MATTTNYAWETPDDTDLVKDGAAAIRTLGSSIDTTTKALNPSTTLGDIEYRSSTANTNTRLPIGTTGQVLAVVGGVPAWATTADQTPLTTKGDIFTFTTVDARLGVGANGTVLTADSAEPTGLKWASAGASGPTFRAYRGSSDQSFSQGVVTKIQFNTEDWDTASAYDSTTNYRFTPTTAGYYNFNLNVYLQAAAAGDCQIILRKNGSNNSSAYFGSVPTNWPPAVNGLVYLNGSSDYIEGFIYFGNGSPVVLNSQINSYFSAIWIRS